MVVQTEANDIAGQVDWDTNIIPELKLKNNGLAYWRLSVLDLLS